MHGDKNGVDSRAVPALRRRAELVRRIAADNPDLDMAQVARAYEQKTGEKIHWQAISPILRGRDHATAAGMSSDADDAEAELEAMRDVYLATSRLDATARWRVFEWVEARYTKSNPKRVPRTPVVIPTEDTPTEG